MGCHHQNRDPERRHAQRRAGPRPPAHEIHAAQQAGLKVLKIVHGYGSTGVGGDLRFALQATLRQMAAKKEIRDCIYGENWRKSDERTWELLKQMPELKSDSDLGRGNKGMTGSAACSRLRYNPRLRLSFLRHCHAMSPSRWMSNRDNRMPDTPSARRHRRLHAGRDVYLPQRL